MPTRAFGQPVADRFGLVRGIVVPHQMNIEVRRYPSLDLVKELTELLGAMTRVAFADDFAGGDIQSGEQRCRAMPGVVMAAPLHLPRAHRHDRLTAIEGLNLRFLIDAQHDSMLGWRDIQSHHIAHLGDELRIGGQFERLMPVRLQTKRPRCTLETETPLARAMPGELQCVAPSGGFPVCAPRQPRSVHHRSFVVCQSAAGRADHRSDATGSGAAMCRR